MKKMAERVFAAPVVAPVLETERLRLRGWTIDDLEPMADFYNNGDDEDLRFVGGRQGRDGAWRVLCLRIGHWHLRGYGPFAVVDKRDDEWVGWCGHLHHVEVTPSEPELAFAVRRDRRNCGIATESSRAVLEFVFGTLRLPELATSVEPDNRASERVISLLGAVRDGTHVRYGVASNIWRFTPTTPPVATLAVTT